MRNALARTLYEIAKQDERVVVIVADISPAGAMDDFRREFPGRFINVGIAEQTMIGLAAGLAQRGMKPVCYTIATFALFRAYEFIRCDLAYQNLPVTVIGMGAGLSYPTLGGTHQAVEDVAVALACPNMDVLAPADPGETRDCTRWALAQETGGPIYMRIGKAGEPDLPSMIESTFWNEGEVRWRYLHLERPDKKFTPTKTTTCVLSYGPIASEALTLAEAIGADMATVPFLSAFSDPAMVPGLSKYSHVIVVEEATGAPLATLVRSVVRPSVAVTSKCLPREFCHLRGTRDQLLDHYGLTATRIMETLHER